MNINFTFLEQAVMSSSSSVRASKPYIPPCGSWSPAEGDFLLLDPPELVLDGVGDCRDFELLHR